VEFGSWRGLRPPVEVLCTGSHTSNLLGTLLPQSEDWLRVEAGTTPALCQFLQCLNSVPPVARAAYSTLASNLPFWHHGGQEEAASPAHVPMVGHSLPFVFTRPQEPSPGPGWWGLLSGLRGLCLDVPEALYQAHLCWCAAYSPECLLKATWHQLD
jgi:hypothetical protein